MLRILFCIGRSGGRMVFFGQVGHVDAADHFADQQGGPALVVGTPRDRAAVLEGRLVALVRDRRAGLQVAQHHVFVRVQV